METFSGKLPTGDKLMYRWCNIASVFSPCRSCSENLEHLFFSCSYAMRLWHWFNKNLKANLSPTSLDDIWRIGGHSLQCSLVINSRIIYIVNGIWNFGNASRFKDKSHIVISTLAIIKDQISRTVNNTNLCATSSMDDFLILKAFDTSLRHGFKLRMRLRVLRLRPLRLLRLVLRPLLHEFLLKDI